MGEELFGWRRQGVRVAGSGYAGEPRPRQTTCFTGTCGMGAVRGDPRHPEMEEKALRGVGAPESSTLVGDCSGNAGHTVHSFASRGI